MSVGRLFGRTHLGLDGNGTATRKSDSKHAKQGGESNGGDLLAPILAAVLEKAIKPSEEEARTLELGSARCVASRIWGI